MMTRWGTLRRSAVNLATGAKRGSGHIPQMLGAMNKPEDSGHPALTVRLRPSQSLSSHRSVDGSSGHLSSLSDGGLGSRETKRSSHERAISNACRQGGKQIFQAGRGESRD